MLKRKEGFIGQRQHVIPAAILERLALHPMLYLLIATDMGWYPDAQYHYRERESGTAEHILIFYVRGTGWVEIGGVRHEVGASEVLLIPRGTAHTYGASDATPWSIHWVHFRGTGADYFAYQLPEHEYILSVDAQSAAALEGLFNQDFRLKTQEIAGICG